MKHFGHQHFTGINRREALQIGYSGLLGLGLPALFAARARGVETAEAASTPGRKAKTVILVFLTGAPSHHDTFDMKPEAPLEIRGEFKPIATSVPGLHVCEHLPEMAARAHHYALVRILLCEGAQRGRFFDARRAPRSPKVQDQ